jgi:hypothetical protein
MRLLLAILLAGCSATFVDDRPPPDPAGADLSEAPRPDLAGVDAGPERVLARGSFGPRDGHLGEGTVEIVESSGTLTLRFGGDFRVSGVPGPVVVVSTRDDMGTTIDPAQGDLDLGTLKATSGAQTYALGADTGRRVVFVYCKPFGVEVARAILGGVP